MTTRTAASAETPPSTRSGLDRYFSITDRGSTVEREVRGGLATFFTMAYIVVLNPLIIATVADADGQLLGDGAAPGGIGDSIGKVAAVTALVAAVMTILMGLVGRYPFALATGLGLNAFVAFSVAADMSWEEAMGLVVLEGLVITLLVLTGFRVAVFNAIPLQLKTAISVGIGLFIALIGFVDAGFIRRTGTGPVPVELGVAGDLVGWPTVVFIFGLLLTAALLVRRTRGAILIGIVASTVLAIVVEAATDTGASFTPGDPPVIKPEGWQLNVPRLPDKVFDTPDLGLIGDFSLFGGFERVGVVAALLLVFTLLITDFFDTMGTVVGVGAEAGLLDAEGRLPGADRVLVVDSLAAVAGGAASASSNTTYIESAAGVGEGARTGLASVVTGVLFLFALFFTPLVAIVPFEAASPALVIVGFLLITQVRNIDFDDYAIAIPAFLTIVIMPFTYSIANGIGAGFVSYVVLRLAQGRAREVHPLLWLVAALFAVYFGLNPIERALGV
ncbi:MAG TPA: NCS2 family permease [Mycobacteriales bacterium]|nr:NCS2 family permease [Mycobacteriales bacterium]